jgi:hypothetical protein
VQIVKLNLLLRLASTYAQHWHRNPIASQPEFKIAKYKFSAKSINLPIFFEK